ncbi:hypothetical protein CVCAS_0237 [Lactococcus lactis subsp. lactis CV56]|nr:hypothetical protein CVCAS_0237 [Lactococcus lactis subsp. lactis CV56]
MLTAFQKEIILKYYLLKSKNSLSLLTDFFVSKNFTDKNND